MSSKSFNYDPIYPGFDWSATLNLVADPSLFPEGVGLRAQVRTEPGAPVIGTLSTATGTIERVDGDRIQVKVSGAMSAKWTEGSVVFDLVRTDGPRPRHLNIRIKIKVKTSLTDPR